MRRFISVAWLLAIFFGAGSARAERFDTYFLDESRLSEMESVGIGPSSDVWEIYGQFAKRFVPVDLPKGQSSAHDIRRIVEAGEGDRRALVFLLLNLFRWNGIDAQLAVISTKRGMKRGGTDIEYLLVYVPSLNQYFDPALPPAVQPKASDRTWLEGRRRMHFAAALWHSGKLIGDCSSSCLDADGGYVGSGSPLPYAVRVKTIRVPGPSVPGPSVPASSDRDGRNPRQ